MKRPPSTTKPDYGSVFSRLRLRLRMGISSSGWRSSYRRPSGPKTGFLALHRLGNNELIIRALARKSRFPSHPKKFRRALVTVACRGEMPVPNGTKFGRSAVLKAVRKPCPVGFLCIRGNARPSYRIRAQASEGILLFSSHRHSRNEESGGPPNRELPRLIGERYPSVARGHSNPAPRSACRVASP